MALAGIVQRAQDSEVRSAITRLITVHMARDATYRVLIQRVDDMRDVVRLAVGQVPLDAILDDEDEEARVLRALALDMSRLPELSDSLRLFLTRRGDTLVDPPTDSVLLAAVCRVLWPYIEVGYHDVERREGLWVAEKPGGLPAGFLHGLVASR